MARPHGSVNKKTMVRLQEQAVNIPTGFDLPETDDEIKARLDKTFRVYNKILRAIVDRKVRSLICLGAPGSGKTYEAEKALLEAQEAGILKYETLKGTSSAVCLFESLFQCSAENQVLLVDDCDAIFSSEESFNLLKVALDMNRNRSWLSWNKVSKYLEKAGVPNNFKFEGSVIFLSNKNMRAEMEAKTKMAPHYAALISRSVLVDLRIHTKREIYCRMEQIIENTSFLEENEIAPKQSVMIMDWIKKNMKNIDVLSPRTVINVAKLMDGDRDWREVAEVTLFKEYVRAR